MDKEERRLYHTKYYQEYKDKECLRSAKYYQEHKEKVCLRNAKYRQAHREERRLHQTKYRQEHKEEQRLYSAKYRRKHKEERRLYNAEYNREHRGKHNAWKSTRRALILGVTIGNLAQIKEIYERARDDRKARCYLCGKPIPKGHRHVDHIIPLSKGGKHTASNLAIACESCNLSKYNKMPSEIGILL
ncbi:MAG: HNH endonuclease [Desulfobacteraceae bacterium]|nr:HNH endonuclease [Desulfobacteraceae bacterium]